MEPTITARPERRGGAAQETEGQVIRFPTGGERRRAWPGLKALLPVPWRRCVVIHGRRYWHPG